MKKTKYSVVSYRGKDSGRIEHHLNGKRNYTAGEIFMQPISFVDTLVQKITEEHSNIMKNRKIIKLETKIVEYVY